jgi:hypothetical protein
MKRILPSIILAVTMLVLGPNSGAQVISGSSGVKKISTGKTGNTGAKPSTTPPAGQPAGTSGVQPSAVTNTQATTPTRALKAMPDLIIKDEVFADLSTNNIIDGGESSYINFKIQNLGQGVARSVYVAVSLKNQSIKGLTYTPRVDIGDIQPNQSKDVVVNIAGGMQMSAGIAEFKIEVLEEKGFDAYPLEMKIETRPFQPPNIVVADAVFSTETGGKIKLNYPIQLKVLVQNIGHGDAKDVNLVFGFPNPDCFYLGETDKFPLGIMKAGETRELDFIFTATRRYKEPTIPISLTIAESYGKYARDSLVRVQLDQDLVAQNNVVISAKVTPTVEVTKASLTSEVDKNIPRTTVRDPNKFALIIGNEEYTKYQSGLNTEVNVAYARNDATIFKEYVLQTLGFTESNVFFLADATTGEMNQKLDLICKLAAKTGNNAEILFYYAGHGLPDENTHVPYLIPVDVSGTNIYQAIRLSDIYKKFSETGAKKVSVFLDACFSGGGRGTGLLAARSVKVKPNEESLGGNLVVFAATSGEQSAMPYAKEKHGMFTYYLLKKMQESQGNISYKDLTDYVSRQVSLESLKINQKEQDPAVNVSSDVASVWQSWKLR